MKHKIAFIVPLAAVLLTACSSDETDMNGISNDSAIPIRLATQLQEPTRAATQNTTVANGEKVYAWCDLNNSVNQYFGAWELTANGAGNLISTATKYYPAKANQLVDFYLLHGKRTFTANADYPTAAYQHTVSTDQTTDAEYAASDLLFGSQQAVKHTNDSVKVTLYHMLSNVRVVLRSTSSAVSDELLGQATVELLNIKPSVNFTATKLDETSMAVQSNRAAMVALDESSTATTIKMSTVVSPKNTQSGTTWSTQGSQAVVPPQTLTAGNVIRVTFNHKKSDGTSDTYDGLTLYAALSEDLTLQSGYYYVLHVTVSPTELSLDNITINAWSAESTDRGGDIDPTDFNRS